MAEAVKPAGGRGQRSADVLVAGAGACGLWFARKAADAGLSVVVAERGRVGTGASGGFLGALMPHTPDRWNAKKQFQLDGLFSLATEIAGLEAETEISCGYARVGRLIPVSRPDLAVLAHERRLLAKENWSGPNGGFGWRVLPGPPASGWPDRSVAGYGIVHEDLAARVHPRLLLAALKRDIERRHNVRLVEGDGVAAIDAETGACLLDSGERVNCSRLVIAAGAASFSMLARLLGRQAVEIGRGVKGQAALLSCNLPSDMPLVYHDGVYVVPHADGTVAVGSTSEDTFSSPSTTDGQLDRLLSRGRRLCPLLADAPVIERWAGVRPRAEGRDPLIGPLPGAPRVVALAGGFKITLGIAHRMAAAALDAIDGGRRVGLPASFRAERRLGEPPTDG